MYELTFFSNDDLTKLETLSTLNCLNLGIIDTIILNAYEDTILINLKRLNIFGGDITSLHGLKHCFNLKNLILSNTNVTCLKSLAFCTKLKELNIGYNTFDLSPLKTLTSLQTIYCYPDRNLYDCLIFQTYLYKMNI